MAASLTGSHFAVPAKGNKQASSEMPARWQTAGLHPECYSPRRQNRALQASDTFYRVLGVLWLMTITVFYIYMVAVVR